MFHIKVWRWLDSNRGPLLSEATALPTEPQPLPIFSYLPTLGYVRQKNTKMIISSSSSWSSLSLSCFFLWAQKLRFVGQIKLRTLSLSLPFSLCKWFLEAVKGVSYPFTTDPTKLWSAKLDGALPFSQEASKNGCGRQQENFVWEGGRKGCAIVCWERERERECVRGYLCVGREREVCVCVLALGCECN